jgi:hypothetical protein
MLWRPSRGGSINFLSRAEGLLKVELVRLKSGNVITEMTLPKFGDISRGLINTRKNCKEDIINQKAISSEDVTNKDIKITNWIIGIISHKVEYLVLEL